MSRTDYLGNPVNEFSGMAEALTELHQLAAKQVEPSPPGKIHLLPTWPCDWGDLPGRRAVAKERGTLWASRHPTSTSQVKTALTMKLETTTKSAGFLLLVWLLAIPGLAATTFAAESSATAVTVNHLRCEYRQDPLGIDTAKPRLSWILNSGRQTAYQVVVDGLWDSGRVESDQSVHVEYAGKPLESRQRCEWKVRVWDQHGKRSAWSEPAQKV
jgi:hypothetical protein